MTECFLSKAGRHPQEVPFERRRGGPQKERDNVRTGVIWVEHEPPAWACGEACCNWGEQASKLGVDPQN